MPPCQTSSLWWHTLSDVSPQAVFMHACFAAWRGDMPRCLHARGAHARARTRKGEATFTCTHTRTTTMHLIQMVTSVGRLHSPHACCAVALQHNQRCCVTSITYAAFAMTGHLEVMILFCSSLHLWCFAHFILVKNGDDILLFIFGWRQHESRHVFLPA